MKTKLILDVDYDPDHTDPEALACALDRLLETALATPDIFDEYVNPSIGKFFVVEDASPRNGSTASHWVLYDFDAHELVGSRIYNDHQEAVDDACQVNDVVVVRLGL